MHEKSFTHGSKVREISIQIFDRVDSLAAKYINHSSIIWVYQKVVKPRLNDLIRTKIPEDELKGILLESYGEIKPIVEELKLAEELKQSEKINDKKLNDKVKEILKVDDLVELFE